MPTNPVAPLLYVLVVAIVLAGTAWLSRHERAYWKAVPRVGRPGRIRAARREVRAAGRPEDIVATPAAGAFDAPGEPAVLTGTFAAGAVGEARVKAVLDAMGLPSVSGKYVESTGGYAQIDHIARVGSRLTVIETKNLSGRIEGEKWAKDWVVHREGKPPLTIHSPVLQVEAHVRHVRMVLGRAADIRHLVVLAGKASPPPGAAACVTTLSGLRERLEAIAAEGHDPFGAYMDWADLMRAIETTPQEQARTAHLIDIERRWPAPKRTLPFTFRKGPRPVPRVPSARPPISAPPTGAGSRPTTTP